MTKTSDDFKKMPLLEVLPDKQTRNSKDRLPAERTLNNHRSKHSHFSSGILGGESAGDLGGAKQGELLATKSSREEQAFATSKSDAAVAPAANTIVVDDVESKSTPSSTFERASSQHKNSGSDEEVRSKEKN